MTETVAVVVVTMNRADLLAGMLAGLAAQTRRPDVVVVVDNASTDHTREVLEAHAAGPDALALDVLHQEANTGGAGGFHTGVRRAYDGGWDRIWLMDDDVVPAPDCLATLMATDGDCLMAVREDLAGRLAEKAAVDFDLRNPLAIHPKKATVETTYGTREAMPPLVELENVAFEGYMVRRRVVDAVGLPDPTYFIFYDDVDWAIRARRAGFTIRAVRDAVLVRQLDFNQQHDLSGWKGFYMYRNLFVVHLRYGENVLVRLKPWMIVLVVVLLSPVRGGRGEAVNVTRAIRAARGMRRLPGSAAPAR
jgi:rhamnopyranosyl-N-acetylglucosaminyl-diphospho-decaprenol beta-1,3/1,4-galactofuranosyltransferase